MHDRHSRKRHWLELRTGLIIAALAPALLAPGAMNGAEAANEPAVEEVAAVERAPRDPGKVAKDIEDAIKDPRVKVEVINLGSAFEPLYGARVTGKVTTEVERVDLERRISAIIAREFSRKSRVFSSIEVDPKEPSAAKKADEIAKEEAEKAKTKNKKPDAFYNEVWHLNFIKDSVASAATGGTSFNDASQLYDVDSLVSGLNKMNKEKDGADIILRNRNDLLLKGPDKTVLTVKRQLVLLDAPGPQVQLDIWPLQVSGKGRLTEDRIAEIGDKIRDRRLQLASLRNLPNMVLAQASQAGTLWREDLKFKEGKESEPSLEEDPYLLTDPVLHDLLSDLRQLNFPTNPQRPLSTTETMLFFGLLSGKERQRLLCNLLRAGSEEIGKTDQCLELCREKCSDNCRLCHDSNDRGAFWRFRRAFATDAASVNAERAAIAEFLDALKDYRIVVSTLDNPQSESTPAPGSDVKEPPPASSGLTTLQRDLSFNIRKSDNESRRIKRKSTRRASDESNSILKNQNAESTPVSTSTPTPAEVEALKDRIARAYGSPERLKGAAIVVDGLLHEAVKAFTADLEQMCLRPLLDDLRTISKRDGSFKGVSMLGRTRMVVTSGLHSSLKPTLISHVETTPPPVLDTKFLLNPTGGETTTPSPLATALQGYSGSQLLAMAALLNQPKPTYTRVAPGIAINVRPAVMPNSASARLQIDASFGVITDSSEKVGGDPLAPPGADAVQSHQLSTDAIIGTYDLFDISSFAITTTHPRPPGYFPVLGQLPIIGRAFQWRRKDTSINHSSIILVNAVILPRSMDLANFFGALTP